MAALERGAVPPQRGEQALGGLARLLGVGVREQDGELVPAEAREDVRIAKPRPQDIGDALDQGVAGAVPEAVVYVLEVVEVEQQHGARGAVALRL